MMHFRFDPHRWTPAGATPHCNITPPVGSIIGLKRRAWRVIEVRALADHEWNDAEREHVARKTAQWATWKIPSSSEIREIRRQSTPHQIVLQPLPEGPLHQVRTRDVERWYVLPEHYPVCSVCGELYPCREIEFDARAAEAKKELERAESILPGCCWECGEPVTSRQKSIRFDGDNLDLPGGPEVVFHTRQRCAGSADAYEKRWVAVDPDRRRWRLRCPGKIVLHVDGPDCTEGPHCPGSDVPHRLWMDHCQGHYSGVPCLRCEDESARRLGGAA
ncbi:hypothetical protein [Allonocardiopsis opalescens]|uniref:Uncharacterized protein n=1 Tax=Allonocardiopsis opalescens TaxID=1144618 RepID=A0A2T0PP55_9ACTN|nr:hypothetical protein [Allonocardiopsis opalescens]PRX90681.1 hypothetical protein CLV72_11819 [Allonocardiopsis opalescens]